MKRIWSSPTLMALALAILVPMVGHSVTHAAQAQATPHRQTARVTATPAVPAQQPAATVATKPSASAPSKTASTHHKQAAHAPRLDLNKAPREALAKLPGIDAALASKIVGSRPFKSRAELLDRRILTREEYRKIRAMVMVAPAPTASKAARPSTTKPKTDAEDPSHGDMKK